MRTEPNTAPALSVRLEHAGLAALCADARVLAVVGTGIDAVRAGNEGAHRDPRLFDLGLHPITAAQGGLQVLRVAGEVALGEAAGVPVAHDGDYLFASVRLDPALTMAEATQRAYIALLGALRAAGYPHLLRMWNFLADINAGSGDAERYRQFCIGRYDAFEALGGVASFPAASALGFAPGAACAGRVAVLAARHRALEVENPNQVSAFRYPRLYGPVSPSFSRASVLSTRAGDVLFVSGTAAITGHVSMHVGDPVAQLQLSLTNIEAVVAAAGFPAQVFAGATPAAAAVTDAHLRVFVRRPEDQSRLAAALAQRVRIAHGIEWLRADVCRADLLVEVEAVLCRPPPP